MYVSTSSEQEHVYERAVLFETDPIRPLKGDRMGEMGCVELGGDKAA